MTLKTSLSTPSFSPYRYKKGFGSVQNEHWLGNNNIHQLTSGHNMELRIDMLYFEKPHWKKYFAKYSKFSVADENQKFQLGVSGHFTGNAGESLAGDHNGKKFSTFDQVQFFTLPAPTRNGI